MKLSLFKVKFTVEGSSSCVFYHVIAPDLGTLETMVMAEVLEDKNLKEGHLDVECLGHLHLNTPARVLIPEEGIPPRSEWPEDNDPAG